jgi:hypothetical protein
MHRNLALIFGAAALAGTLSLASCAQATAKSDAPRPTPTSATARDHANIMIYSINSDGPDFRAIVTGAIGDYGPGVSVYPDGRVDPAHDSEIELKLTRGSFRLNIGELDKRFVMEASHEPIFPGTCSDVFGLTVAVPIVPRSGIGAYRGITGGFTVTLTGDEVQAKPCNGTLRFLWQVLVLAGPGTVRI